MSSEKQGLVVIGAGVTGLSAAIAWARNVDVDQRPVLVLEQQPLVGGYVTSFKRKGFLFDTSQIITDSSDLIDYLGLELELKQFSGYYARIFLAEPKTGTAEVINIPSGYDAFTQMLKERYPQEAERVDRFMSYSRAMFDELRGLKVEPNLLQLLKTVLTCPKIIKNRNRTFREYIDGFGFKDQELCEIFDVFAAFSGLSCERVAALLTVSAMNSSLNGSFRPTRGFIAFPQAMRKRLKELGGQIRTKARVEKILVDGGRVTGVRLEGGEQIEAEQVVTTIDPTVAMKELVGLDTLRALDRKYAAKVESLKMSTSGFLISLGLDDDIDLASLGLDCGYNIVTTGRGAFERLFQAFDAGSPGICTDCFHIGVICPSLTTGNKPTIAIRVVPAPIADWAALRGQDYDAYRERKEAFADFVVELAERYVVPDLRQHIVVRDVATPATFARYSGSPTGANYDMAPYPENFGRNRLRMRTPVEGLFQPKISHGIWPSLLGGLQVVDMILEGKVMNGYSRL